MKIVRRFFHGIVDDEGAMRVNDIIEHRMSVELDIPLTLDEVIRILRDNKERYFASISKGVYIIGFPP